MFLHRGSFLCCLHNLGRFIQCCRDFFVFGLNPPEFFSAFDRAPGGKCRASPPPCFCCRCQDIHIAVMVQHGCLGVHAIGGGTPPGCGNAGVNGIAHSSIQEKAFSRLPINPLVFLGVHRHHLLIKKQNFFEKTHNASISPYTFFRDCPQM